MNALRFIIYSYIIISLNYIFGNNIDLSHYDFKKEKEERIQKDYKEGIAKKQGELKKLDISDIERTYMLDCYKIDYAVDLLQYYESSTMGINKALDYGYVEYDKLLNKYYNLYKKQLNKEEKEALLAEQRAWLKLRDIYVDNYIRAHHTHIYVINGGGTMYSNLASYESLRFLKERVEILYQYYKQHSNGDGIEF